MKQLILNITGLGLLAIIFTACSTSPDTNTPQIRLNAMVTTSTALQPKLISTASPVIQITEAKMLIREIEFESAVDEDSLDFETGPLVLNLDLSGGLTEVSVTDVRAGVYNEIEFDIHKPEDNEIPSDPDLRIGDGGNERFSIIIKGTVDNEPFLFRSTENFEIELEFDANFVIDGNADGIFDITLSATINTWFIDGNGAALNPGNANDWDEIENAIARSFDAFEDDDRDGEEDD